MSDRTIPSTESQLTDSQLAAALLGAIENHVLPLTRQGVAAGNKIFGAALLRKSDGSVVLAETNNETENPLWHGEVHLLKRYREVAGLPPPEQLIFLSTHEPCSMCLSAITWAGFDNFFDFFTHEDSRDSFAIPHDLKILKEVFTLDPGGYRRQNAYWTARSVAEVIDGADAAAQPALRARVKAIHDEYAALSDSYQDGKAGNAIPLR
ncbi:nucleoside deaminase [Paracoccus pacificus]|uniref:Nucleoside deaminase n=1 Tax=Paracoccus pacificus TaxID=1463598 RepID=A0ABW4RB41_9RHOB